MPIAFGGALGSNTNKTTGTTVTLTTGAIVPIGALVVVTWAADNLSATTPTLSSVTDSKGNTYTVIANVGSGSATAAAGQVAGIAVSRLTVALTAADTISAIASSASTVVKAVDAAYFTGATIATRAAATTATGNGTAPSVNYTAGVSGDLLIGVVGNQNNALPTGDADTTNGSWNVLGGVASTGGNAATNISVYSQYKILTATGSQTYNVTIASGQWSIATVALIPATTVSRTATNAGTGTESAFRNIPPVGINWGVWGTRAMISPIFVDVLVVAGGGGGGAGGGGGGGGGGFRTISSAYSVGDTLAVTVGAGGAGGTLPNNDGQKGGDSTCIITSTGGGYGPGNAGGVGLGIAGNGGSGGGQGASGNSSIPGAIGLGNTPSTSPSQGNNGGTNGAFYTTPFPAGGGGGAGAVGGNATAVNAAGNGGAGASNSYSGASVTYAGGGGGGTYNSPNNAGAGGSGGGGTGGNGNAGTAGTANTGGGGGGSSNTWAGNAGGSGIVIIRYPDTNAAARATTGSPAVTQTGGYRIYTFTGSGTITF